MRILHLSDLHFGTETQDLQEDLIEHIQAISADLVIVSGDFTQVGSATEFDRARVFLGMLGIPVFCIPGNHDIPRMHFMERLLNPYRKYKAFITDDLCPVLHRDEVTIAGINTARRVLPHWNWAHGAISAEQLVHLKQVFEKNPRNLKICVMHHPVHKAASNAHKTIVFGARSALQSLLKMKVDIVLTGHVHHASVTIMEDDGHQTIFLSASTALSTRLRLQKNGFNTIDIEGRKITVKIHAYNNGVFDCLEKVELTA